MKFNLNAFEKILKRFYCYKTIKRPSLMNPIIKKPSPVKIDKLKKEISLANQLRLKILATGPLTVADYMKQILTNPTTGYYMNRDVFGVEGDFITSPEIGQIFGELIAVWCLNEWQKIGSPAPLQIIELGPGRGTLSKDILKVFTHFKLSRKISLHLVEISPHLSKMQADKICYQHFEVQSNNPKDVLHYQEGETVSGVKVYWYYRVEDVPREFSIVLAHEFFDALPIHKLQKDEKTGEWKEILIDIDKEKQNHFRFVLSNYPTPVSKVFHPLKNESRECLEISLDSLTLIDHLAERFEEVGGFGLIMDYGHMGEKTDTFRAFKKHKLHDPLEDPGTADLTADVDFLQIKHHAERHGKLITFGPVEQGEFLEKMEGQARLEVLLENTLPDNQERIRSGYEMLTSPEQMGKRFKFFSMFPSVLRDYLQKFPVVGFISK